MALQAEQVAHAELVGGSQISLHSHAGGGGADVKSGQETGISCGSSRDVIFTTAFSSTPNVVSVSDVTQSKDHAIRIGAVSTAGFTIYVDKTHTGGACANVGVYWIATNAGNP